jgi:3-oxoadipate enol-lactonase
MLSYEKHGDGTPLVLIHAFPLSRVMWHSTAALFQKQFKVILPDLPGFGLSDRQKQPSIAGMAAEIAALLDFLKITEPVILAGLSMGGYTAFEFQRQFPKRVRALGLFATRAKPDSPEARENRFKSIEALDKFGMEPFAKKIVKSQLGKTTLETKPEVTEQVTAMMTANAKEGAMDALKAMADRRDSSDLLSAVRVPTLVVAGNEDTIVPAADMENMSRSIPGAEFHAVAQSGHLINLEQPAAFHSLLKSFLAKL